MNDQDKSREQLIAELENLRQRVGGLEVQLARSQQAEADQRHITNNMPVLVATAGLDGYYKEVNAAFERILGWSEQESLARPFLDFIHPEDRAAAVETFARLKAGTPAVNFLDRNICKDGSHRWINWIVIPVPERDVVFGIGQDITEKKQAQDELRRSEARWRSVVDDAPVQVTTVDEAGTILLINRPAPGLTLEHVIGRSVYEFLQPEDCDQARQCLEQVFRTGGTVVNESMATGPHGTRSWYETRLGPVKVDGQVVAVTLISSDITERKRAEEELQKGNERLEQRIEERTADLTTANELLQAEVQHRRQAEEALRQNEAKYRALVESSPDAVAMVDLQGRIVFASQRAAEQHGVLHPDELIGSQATDFVVEADRDQFRASLGRLIEEGIHRNVEYTLLRKDGTKFDVELSSAVIRDAAGKPESMMAVYRDVSERKQTQEKLAMLGRFAEAAAQGFGMARVDGQITYVNPFLARLFGAQRPEDVIGTHISACYPPDHMLRRETEIIPALRRRESWRGEQKMVFPDGRMHTTIHTVFPVLDDKGKLLYAAAVITDITELAQTQEALSQSCQQLRASEERFELVVQASGVGIWDWDIRTGKAYYSPRCKTLIGYDENENIGSFEDWASRLHPDEREWIFTAQDEFLAGTSMTTTAEYRVRDKDGNIRWIMAHILAVRDAEGKARRVLSSLVDITDRKLAEEIVKAEQQVLRHMVLAGDRERRLITYELHDGVAQQLLGALMHFQSQEPRRSRKSKGGDAYRAGMEALRHAASELRGVMNWLRTPVLDKFGVAEAIEDVAAQLRLAPGAPEIECHLDVKFTRLEPTLENSLFRIAQEAMTNACRHSQSEKVRVKLTQKDDQVTLEVRDWGIGFDQDKVQENRFGLEGIRERSRILGGKLGIKSEPGKGTIVRAKFPVTEATGQV